MKIDAPVITPSDSPNIPLRDFFAAHALSGMLANGFLPNQVESVCKIHSTTFDFPKAAFLLADAMLTARSIKQDGVN